MTVYSGDDRKPVRPARELEILVDGEGVDSSAEVVFKGRRGVRDVAAVSVATEHFRESVERNVAALREIFERVAEPGSAFPLREVQVSFEVSAKGGFQLIGTSEVQGKGAITLVFQAPDSRTAG
ncbi:hypothetical protein [Streptomyces sp. NPDC051310]|uniref:Pepco domain-containing protein n=1 Tax=Streptomyces sp. NPDC051310 TaxID=3365649 RepID=UPI0037BB89BE